MSLSECAPWSLTDKVHVVSEVEAEAVKMLFASLSPADAKAEAAKKSADGRLPLQNIALCAHGPHSIEVFTAVLNAYPQAAAKENKDTFGNLLLHTVARCMGGVEGLQAIRLLLAENPQAAEEKDWEGSLPIHLICYNSKATLEMVQELLSAYPKGIHAECTYSRKPYATATHYMKIPGDAIDFLRRAQQGESQADPGWAGPGRPQSPPFVSLLSCLFLVAAVAYY
jgi:ankyrin repeat protein